MKIMVNGVVVDATPEQEENILAFQQGLNRNLEMYLMKLQEIIDTKASEKSYANGVSCASYVTSSNPQWAAEAQAFVQWRDLVFEYAFEYQANVQNGDIENPTVNDFIAGIPQLVWPEISNQ